MQPSESGSVGPVPPFGAGAQGSAAHGSATPAGAAPQKAGDAGYTDGAWHRMHPLTPLLKGGLTLLVVIGIVVANLRERLITWFVSKVSPGDLDFSDYGGDPIEWMIANNAITTVALIVLGGLLVLLVIFWLMWKFHDFRITGDHVEVRKGILFRSHRRAPLDRVQGVNVTRPFLARLIGLAKLEVVGAGSDSNVDLEYLATHRAEAVRVDILRLASGARLAQQAAREGHDPTSSRVHQFADSVSAGVTELIVGVDRDDVAPESVVRIPVGRLVASQAINGVMWLLFFGAIFAVAVGSMIPIMLNEGPEAVGGILLMVLGMGVPLVIALVAVIWAPIARSLRYSIAPTIDGLRISFGLTTTVTETIPPGRIFAIEVLQPLLWRPFGWWTVRINRMTGKSLQQQQSSTAQQFNVVLPVGKREDVERVLSLLLPDAPATMLPLVWEHGVLGPVEGDPYLTMARRSRWRRPFSGKRHGAVVSDFALYVRRGRIWRTLGIFPLVRMQGFDLAQGPIERLQRVASVRPHSIAGPVHGRIVGIDRDQAIALHEYVSQATTHAVSSDRGHRWAEGMVLTDLAPGQPAVGVVLPELTAVPPLMPPTRPAGPPLPPPAPAAPAAAAAPAAPAPTAAAPPAPTNPPQEDPHES